MKTHLNGWDPTNPQLILYINGELIQGIDVNHTEAVLEHNVVKGATYQIDLHEHLFTYSLYPHKGDWKLAGGTAP